MQPVQHGLGFEGNAQAGWIETNVLSKATAFVNAANTCFQTIWEDAETRAVTAAMLESAKRAWKTRVPPAPALNGQTLLAACREDPGAFRSVFVMAYNAPLAPGGKKALAKVRRNAVPAAPEIADFRRAWGYQFANVVPPGTWLVDLDCTNPGQISVHGCARVTELRLRVPNDNDLTIAIRGTVQLPGSPHRLVISKNEKTQLVGVAKRLLAYQGG